jgi:hypothetical protein
LEARVSSSPEDLCRPSRMRSSFVSNFGSIVGMPTTRRVIFAEIWSTEVVQQSQSCQAEELAAGNALCIRRNNETDQWRCAARTTRDGPGHSAHKILCDARDASIEAIEETLTSMLSHRHHNKGRTDGLSGEAYRTTMPDNGNDPFARYRTAGIQLSSRPPTLRERSHRGLAPSARSRASERRSRGVIEPSRGITMPIVPRPALMASLFLCLGTAAPRPSAWATNHGCRA